MVQNSASIARLLVLLLAVSVSMQSLPSESAAAGALFGEVRCEENRQTQEDSGEKAHFAQESRGEPSVRANSLEWLLLLAAIACLRYAAYALRAPRIKTPQALCVRMNH